MTTWSGFWYGSGRSSIVCTSEKMVVLAPMPSASVPIAATVKTGVFRSTRSGVPQVGKEIHGALDGRQRAPVGATRGPLLGPVNAMRRWRRSPAASR